MFARSNVSTLFILIAMVAIPAGAQRRATGRRTPDLPSAGAELQVRVRFDDERPVPRNTRVQLIRGGVPANEGYTDDQGQVSFRASAGSYHLEVSGLEIEETTSDAFEIDVRETFHNEFVRVPHKIEAGGAGSMESSVAVVDLNVPGKAQKEFSHGSEALAKNNLPEARKRFEKAIALYPVYATAFNSLGVVYMKSGETQLARSSFEQATKLNDHYSDAYLNLGKLVYGEKKYLEAEAVLVKIPSSAPQYAIALTIMSDAELMTGKLDLAAGNARRVHALSPHHPAMVHLVAARALGLQGKRQDAIHEYKTFLLEDPNSPSAPKIRNGLAQAEKYDLEKAAAVNDSAAKPGAGKEQTLNRASQLPPAQPSPPPPSNPEKPRR